MWRAITDSLDSQTIRLTLSDEGGELSVRSMFELCSSSEPFVEFWSSTLAGSAFDGFFWELPPITDAGADAAFQCVLIRGAVLARLAADAAAFAEHFECLENGRTVARFRNIGGDAELISPAPLAPDHRCYGHLAEFVRAAPSPQVVEFWQVVGDAALSRLSTVPFWLSTAGLGVLWLHARLDSYPKYYRHTPYRTHP